MTAQEAARILGERTGRGMSPQRVKQYIKAGRLVAYKIDGRWDVTPESVAAFTTGKPGRPKKEG